MLGAMLPRVRSRGRVAGQQGPPGRAGGPGLGDTGPPSFLETAWGCEGLPPHNVVGRARGRRWRRGLGSFLDHVRASTAACNGLAGEDSLQKEQTQRQRTRKQSNLKKRPGSRREETCLVWSPPGLRPPSDGLHVLPACSFPRRPNSLWTPEFSGRVLPHHWLRAWHRAGHQVGTQ